MPKDDSVTIPRFTHELTLRINVIRLTACVTDNSSEVGEHSALPESCEKSRGAAGYADNLPGIVDGSCISAIHSQGAEICKNSIAPKKRVPAPISRQSHRADHLASVVEASRPANGPSQVAEVYHLAVLPDKERVYGGNAGGRIRNRIKIGLASYLSAFVDQPGTTVGTA